MQILQAQGFGVVTIGLGAIFLLLGFWVRRKSTVALGIAVTIYALDGILSLLTGNFLSVPAHIFFLLLMSRGFSAIRDILAAEANLPASKGAKFTSMQEFVLDTRGKRLQVSKENGVDDTTAMVKSIRLITPGRKGFAGIGKKPNQYEAEVLQPAVVSVTYRTKVRISATIGEKKEETKTIPSQVQALRSDVLLEPVSVTGEVMSAKQPSNAKPDDDEGDGSIGRTDGLLCTNCGTGNPLQARFCTKCGQSLEPIEQISTMQFRESSSFSADDAPAGLNAEASTAPLPPQRVKKLPLLPESRRR